MCFQNVVDILIAIGTIGAVIVALFSIHFSKKSSKNEILVHKLQELYELILKAGKYYGKIAELYIRINKIKNEEKNEAEKLSYYNDIRDAILPNKEKDEVANLLSRIDIFTNCYIENELKSLILKYSDFLYAYLEFATNAGSIYSDLKKIKFIEAEEFYNMHNEISVRLINEIKKVFKCLCRTSRQPQLCLRNFALQRFYSCCGYLRGVEVDPPPPEREQS
jgi:hypothetical protein